MSAQFLLARCLECAELVVALMQTGLKHLGASLSAVPPGETPDQPQPPGSWTTPPAEHTRIPDPRDDEVIGDDQLGVTDGPAPGHPERLLPNVPPTRMEAQLWRHLDLYP